MTDGMDWTHWLFREEKLHTAVLAHLLAGKQGDAVAAALVDFGATQGHAGEVAVDRERDHNGDGQRVTDRPVRFVALESRVASRMADLTCRVLTNGVPRRLIVETKVDSIGKREQLDEMSWANDHAVLLALGTSAFDRSQLDLDKDADSRFIRFETSHLGLYNLTPAERVRATNAGARAWSTVTPSLWLGVLEVGGALGDAALEPYVRRMRLEAELHARAERAARVGVAIELGDLELPRTDEGETAARADRLLASSWALEIRRLAWEGVPELNLEARRDARGVRLGVYPAGWSRGSQGDVFLQLDVSVGGVNTAPHAEARVKASGSARADVDVLSALGRSEILTPTAASREGETLTLATAAAGRLDGNPKAAATWILDVVAELHPAVVGSTR